MPPNPPKPPSDRCASCQRPASTKCSGCLDAPVYEKVSKPTFYCNKVCQQADWDHHKSDCRRLQERKKLQRAAILLQAIYHRIRIHASTMWFDKMVVNGSKVTLHGYRPGIVNTTRHLNPFQLSLDGCKDREAIEATLTFMGCMESLMYLYHFTNDLLASQGFDVKEINATMTNPTLRIIPIHPDKSRMDVSVMYHNLYKVTLKNGDVWAVDPTAAQFGYPSPLWPFHDLVKNRSTEVNEGEGLGHIRFITYKGRGHDPHRYFIAKKLAQEELAALIDAKIPQLAQGLGGKLGNILKGSDAAFEKAKEVLLTQLGDWIKASLLHLYLPTQILKRAQMIEAKISKDKEDGPW